jgi:hypothetical protein
MRDEGAEAAPAAIQQTALPHKDISVLGLLWSSLLSRFKRLFN